MARVGKPSSACWVTRTRVEITSRIAFGCSDFYFFGICVGNTDACFFFDISVGKANSFFFFEFCVGNTRAFKYGGPRARSGQFYGSAYLNSSKQKKKQKKSQI